LPRRLRPRAGATASSSTPCASRRWSSASRPASNGCCDPAHLPWSKALADYDHSGRIEAAPWQELEALSRQSEWLQRGENMLLFGPSGVGKTHLAVGIALAQIGLDQACRFYPATSLVQELQKARAEYNLPAALERLDRYPLLLIDDIGYVRRDEQESSVLFELICHRYERRSLLITANQPFTAWMRSFPAAQ
jgi:DNA replication protein DnaC